MTDVNGKEKRITDKSESSLIAPHTERERLLVFVEDGFRSFTHRELCLG